MRIKLTLRPRERKCTIPINYQYPLSAAIYKILSSGSPEYAQWLHHKGYLSPNGKPMKLFVFSKLYIPKVQRKDLTLIASNYPACRLLVASPMLEDFVQNFVMGLFSAQEISIGCPYTVGRFAVEQVETLAMPQFQPTTRFRCLSPIVVSTMRERNGRPQTHYYRPDEEGLSQAIRNNLIHKYETIHKRLPTNDHLEFALDDEYVRKKGSPENLSKLITIKEGDAEQETHIKAFESYFYLSGSIELMQVAWECGIGSQNSQGFGMIEVVKA